ncbi:Protochlorophyllide-dependent translocon component 52 [Hibiscus syriacus]|uniref:Protochlorophyllide-dependent translocon component 52 n=1 Tax=Hibiscus syriacus TaxID=106335 RepID=A0A6A2YGX1_HIBSY|nr:protochlorophyllide-dependent translocon component 52, chloroplastic-like [Hibiscus syriacus]KAE8673634.1 Protochlorophyllide-dependent translocon component 52 [Hibiscus syriacus]
MDVLRASSAIVPAPFIPTSKTQFHKPIFHNFTPKPGFKSSFHRNPSKSRLFTTLSSSPTTESVEPPQPEVEIDSGKEKFDWYSQWYPVMPVCDLEKTKPHAKKILGLDLVVWWDRNENEWKVFDDTCPHRLAPLSEGRIDQWGRLQCVYHGWCFGGNGDCKIIPQAPLDGPPVHTFKKACVAVYPSTVQHDIVWVWPNADPQYKDIITKKKPPYIPVLDDPSYTKLMGNRDIPYGYDVLVENLMDPSHVPYAHYGLMRTRTPTVKVDREGGRPLEMRVKKLDINGYAATQDWSNMNFIAPCIFHAFADSDTDTDSEVDRGNGSAASSESQKAPPPNRRLSLIFMCVPVSPGNSRLIWTFPRNFGVWIDRIVPRWLFHIGQNLILDSDLYLLHVEERKIMEIGSTNWQKACFVPTKSDALVVGFRRWFNKYAGGEIDWKGKFSGALPPTPPREQLMDRYWTHVVNCKSCKTAYKGLNALEVLLQIVSVISIGIVAAMKQNMMSMVARTAIVSTAIVCFAASRWLAHFIYKTFHYHDYNHAVV